MPTSQLQARQSEPIRSGWLRVFLAAIVLSVFPAATVQAGLLSKIVRESGDAASGAGKHLDKALPSVGDGVWLAKKLPDVGNAENFALLPGENGAWRLVSSKGDEVPLSSLDKLSETVENASSRQIRNRSGDVVSSGTGKAQGLQVAIRETDFFKLRDTALAVPKNVNLQLVRASGLAHPVTAISIGNRRRLVVELGKDIFLNPTNARALDANLKYMNTSVKKGNLAIAGFDSGAKVSQSTANQGFGGLVSTLDADILESSLAKFKNRTLLVSGKISPDPQTGVLKLTVKDNGKTRTIDIGKFEAAAERQRVNLLIVDSRSTVQPGKTWFSKTGVEKRFAKAQESLTQEDLMRALSPKNAKTLVNVGEMGGTRVTMSTRYAAAPKAEAASDHTVGSWLLEAGFRTGMRAVRINAENPDHTEEMNNRWVPWFSNFHLIGGAAFLLAFAYVSITTWKWWMSAWRMIGRKFSGSDGVSRSVRIVQIITFVPFGILAFVPAVFWIVLRDNFLFFSWPIRKVFAMFSKA